MARAISTRPANIRGRCGCKLGRGRVGGGRSRSRSTRPLARPAARPVASVRVPVVARLALRLSQAPAAHRARRHEDRAKTTCRIRAKDSHTLGLCLPIRDRRISRLLGRATLDKAMDGTAILNRLCVYLD